MSVSRLPNGGRGPNIWEATPGYVHTCCRRPDMSDSDATSEGPGQGRRRSTVFIVVFLAVQIALPVSYYLGDDVWDERFAWRMFSHIRMSSCKTQAVGVREDSRQQRIRIWRDVQIAWRNLVKRNRDAVIRGFVRRQCQQGEWAQVKVRNFCQKPDKEGSRHVWTADCESGDVEREDEILDEGNG